MNIDINSHRTRSRMRSSIFVVVDTGEAPVSRRCHGLSRREYHEQPPQEHRAQPSLNLTGMYRSGPSIRMGRRCFSFAVCHCSLPSRPISSIITLSSLSPRSSARQSPVRNSDLTQRPVTVPHIIQRPRRINTGSQFRGSRIRRRGPLGPLALRSVTHGTHQVAQCALAQSSRCAGVRLCGEVHARARLRELRSGRRARGYRACRAGNR